MLQTLHTEGLGPFKTLDMTFGSRLNLITGDNGIGKSVILDWVWQALNLDRHYSLIEQRTNSGDRDWLVKASFLNTKNGQVSEFEEGNGQFLSEESKEFGIVGSHKLDSSQHLCIYYSVKSEFTICEPFKRPPSYQGSSYWGSYSDTLAFDAIWSSGVSNPKNTFIVISQGILNDWVTWQLRKDIGQQFNIFKKIAEVLFEGIDEKPEFLDKLGHDRVKYGVLDIPCIKLPYASTVLITNLSMGFKRILTLAYILVWTWNRHRELAQEQGVNPVNCITLIIDEIELHLHPKWQRKIVPALLKAVECLDPELKVQIIATTHSPMVTASLEPLFDPDQDKLFTLELENGEVQCKDVPFSAQGSASNWLESDVFGLNASYSAEAAKAIEETALFMDQPDLTLQKLEEAEAQGLISNLPSSHPYWPAWLALKHRFKSGKAA